MGLLDWMKGNKKQERLYTFVIQDIFTIKSQGCVVVGVVKTNPIHVGDLVYIIKRNKKFLEAVVSAMEVPGKRMEEAPPGTNVALMFRDVSSSDLEKGDVISNQRPTFSYQNEQENPRLRGLVAERGYTILENLEGYIEEEMALYRKQETTCEMEKKKGGAELPR